MVYAWAYRSKFFFAGFVASLLMHVRAHVNIVALSVWLVAFVHDQLYADIDTVNSKHNQQYDLPLTVAMLRSSS